MKFSRRIVRFASLCAFALTASLAFAQAPQGRGGAGGRGGAPDNVMPARQLKPGLFLITGAGANTMVRVTTEGLIVADTKNPGDDQFNGLIAQIKAVSPQPVKYVLNTQHHPDHVGNNQKFIDMGAQVVADRKSTRLNSSHRT